MIRFVLAGLLLISFAEVELRAQVKAIYWTQSGQINRANPDGSEVETVFRSSSIDVIQMEIDAQDGKVYLMDYSLYIHPFRLERFNLDGSEPEEGIINDLGEVGALALDKPGGKVYWTSHRNPTRMDAVRKIQRANLDGSNVEDLITVSREGYFRGIAIDSDAETMYWTEVDFDLDTASIWRSDLDGSEAEKILNYGPSRWPSRIELDPLDKKIYWIENKEEAIKRANLDGSNVEIVIDQNSIFSDLAVDPIAGHLYWLDTERSTFNFATTKIKRANLDGSDVIDLIPAPGYTWSIALLSDPFTSAEDISSEFSVSPAYPNPFRSNTAIPYNLPISGQVEIKVYDVLGREVSTLDAGFKPIGYHEAFWDGRHQPAGLYFIKVTNDEGISHLETVIKVD